MYDKNNSFQFLTEEEIPIKYKGENQLMYFWKHFI